VVVPRAARIGWAAALGLVVVAALVVVGVRYGGPVKIADRTWNAFKSPTVPTEANLNKRLFSFSGNGRVDLWRAAWHDHDANPMLGSGAGTFQEYWYEHRTSDLQVRDAHSLYAEVLGEMGPIGLALLGLAL